MNPSATIIGLDFDNTLATYDRLFHDLALEQGLIDRNLPARKTAVRDAVRRLDQGEIKWRELQALAYGPLIMRAEVSPGAKSFIQRCLGEGLAVHIISHKTEYAAQNPNGCHLHAAAYEWLEQNDFLAPSKGGLTKNQIHFLPTREQKVVKIKTLHCRVFVDDLAETFLEPGFPAGVMGIHYGADAGTPAIRGIASAEHFRDVESIIFG